MSSTNEYVKQLIKGVYSGTLLVNGNASIITVNVDDRVKVKADLYAFFDKNKFPYDDVKEDRSSFNVTKIKADMETAKTNLNSQLATLYAKYELAAPDFQSGAITIDKGVDALFRDIKVTVSEVGAVTIKSADGAKTLVAGSMSGIKDKSSIFTSYSSIKNLPGATVTITTATCDTGYVGATATTSVPIPGNCGTVTYCVSQTNPTGSAYYLIGGKKITIDLAQMIPSVTNTSYVTYIQNLGQQIATACTK